MQEMLRSFQREIKNNKGLTLIELIVSISIMTIVLGSIFFIFLPSVRLNNILMHSYVNNISRTNIVEIIKELGVANALDFKLLNNESDVSGVNTNWIKWEDNSLYFNGRIVYKTESREGFEVYFSKKDSNVLVITIVAGGYEDLEVFVLLHNLELNSTIETGSGLDDKFTIIEWTPVTFKIEN